jgi:hypothetical protein
VECSIFLCAAGGFLYCYHLGVLWELTRLGILPPPALPVTNDPDKLQRSPVKLAGASAGALAIATCVDLVLLASATHTELHVWCGSKGRPAPVRNL